MTVTALDILNRCRDGAAQVERLQARLERLRMCAADPRAIVQDEARITEALKLRTTQLDAERVASCRIVDTMPEPECSIMYRYYVIGQSQGAITEAMHYATGYYKQKKKSGQQMADRISGERLDGLLPEWYELG